MAAEVVRLVADRATWVPVLAMEVAPCAVKAAAMLSTPMPMVGSLPLPVRVAVLSSNCTA
jgi:hypothetical protein